MVLTFPHTNPIAFEKEVDGYQPYMDAYDQEGELCWAMPVVPEDLVTFQLSWRGNGDRLKLKVDIVKVFENGDTDTANLNVISPVGVSWGADSVNNTWGYRQVKSGIYYNGVFHVNRAVSSFGTVGLKYFRFRVGIDNAGGTDYVFYRSSWCECVKGTNGTKQIRYTDSRKYVYDTYFGEMPNMYTLRLPANFSHPTPRVEKQIFQGYDMSPELVSAIPYETETLNIGGARGIPDYMVKNLNYIFHCDTKMIDGVEYELTPEGKIEPQRVSKYNLSWLQVEMARKETQNGINTEFGTVFSSGLGPMVVDGCSISVNVESGTAWSLNIDTGNIEFTSRCGVGSAVVGFVSRANTGASTEYSIIDLIVGGRIVSTKTIAIPPITTGIGYGSIGDTLYVKSK